MWELVPCLVERFRCLAYLFRGGRGLLGCHAVNVVKDVELAGVSTCWHGVD